MDRQRKAPKLPTMKPMRRVKMLVLGAPGTGKSCLIKRYCEKRFVKKYIPTIAIDYGVTTYETTPETIRVNLFDTAGAPEFSSARTEFLPNTQAFVLVFDVTRKESFQNLLQCIIEVQDQLGTNALHEVPVVVCGNKCDQGSREVTEDEAQLWAESRGFRYLETSAKTGDNVSMVFDVAVMGILKRMAAGDGSLSGVTPTFTKEQASHAQSILNAATDEEALGLSGQGPFSTSTITKAFKQRASLVHPDKNKAPSSGEAFRRLVCPCSLICPGALFQERLHRLRSLTWIKQNTTRHV
eukprot:m.66828 g.66828  ORF g.66828 m.66828 type:complete len:297 (+) comp12144_c1_seq3:170-1060(+)